jgi:prophage regulatory protein
VTTPESRRILRLPDVMRKSGLARDTLYRRARTGDFPKPVKLSERASGWFEDEIDAWLAQRAAERDRPQAA